MFTCSECGGPIRNRTRSDAGTCSNACRQRKFYRLRSTRLTLLTGLEARVDALTSRVASLEEGAELGARAHRIASE